MIIHPLSKHLLRFANVIDAQESTHDHLHVNFSWKIPHSCFWMARPRRILWSSTWLLIVGSLTGTPTSHSLLSLYCRYYSMGGVMEHAARFHNSTTSASTPQPLYYHHYLRLPPA